MSLRVISDPEYKNWIAELSKRYRSAQIKAAIAVNKEMLKFYWELGKEIVERQDENKYGSGFFKQLSQDLKLENPDANCFSVKNLYYIRNFYLFYSKIFPQVEGKSDKDIILAQPKANFPQVGGNLQNIEKEIFNIPWKHHTLLIDKFSDTPQTALFYVKETIKHGWSRAVLDHMIDSGLHLRQGKAITNFTNTLPEPTSELAQELTKDPYIFDFTNLTVPYRERELKNELLKNITNFLLELGEGFAFLGKEYRLKVGDSEQYIDLLFYHLKIRAYFVLEVKVTAFEPGFIGQLGTYVTAVNHILKSDIDNPTIGLLICKTKDDVLAQYSLEGYNLPIGVSQYQLEKFLPENFRSALPSIEEIESKLKD